MVALHCLGPPLLQVALRRLDAALQSGGALQTYLRPPLTHHCRVHILPALRTGQYLWQVRTGQY